MATKKDSYRDMQAELQSVIAQMQDENANIDEAAALYERGMALIQAMQQHLTATENKITKIQASFDKAA